MLGQLAEITQDKMTSSDRVFTIEQIEGEGAKNTLGIVDNRLFKGGNKLHAIKDSQTNLWGFKYENGAVPGALVQKFTSFPKLLKHAEAYFLARGLSIKEDING